MSSGESLDLNLYSRQFYVLGESAMLKMASTSVLVYGIDGLGVEIAKNLILGGFKSVHIMDHENVSKMDLSTNYYASDSDVNSSRVGAVVKKLAELNSYVEVSANEGKLEEEHFLKHKVVVVVNKPLADLRIYSSWARLHNTKVIFTSSFGLVGQIFCDFGPKFESLDPTGREPARVMVSCVSEEGHVYMVDGRLHGLSVGDYIRLPTCDGNGALSEPIMVEATTPAALSIDPSCVSKYNLTRGDALQVMMPETFSFLPFEESLKKPDTIMGDLMKSDKMSTFHLVFFVLGMFAEKYGRYPKIHNKDDSLKFCDLLNELNTGDHVPLVEKVDLKLCQTIAMQADACFAPLHGVIGGFVAQEVIKASGQKYSPLNQWFYYDCLELVQDDCWMEEDESNFVPKDSEYFRNSGQISIFGRKVQVLLENSSTFIVGAGAIGCELLKNIALMSVACGKEASIHVTDMDTIERSNLNRQFLFRNSDIGQLKSDSAVRAAKKMNDRLNMTSYSLKVGDETESVFHNKFYNSLTCVMNALDNDGARRYVDNRCVLAQRPLIDGGTLGTLGNVQVVIPFKTESYGSTYDQVEKSFAICTLKNFPYEIEHTIQWARDKFEGLFKQTPELLSSMLKDSDFLTKKFDPESYEFGENVKNLHELWNSKPESFEDCIVYGLKLFEEYFNHSIKQLLFNMPPDHVSSFGLPFWIAPKKCPKPLDFDVENKLHVDFVIATAVLRACNFGIPLSMDSKFVNGVISAFQLTEFVPKKGVFIAEADEDEKKNIQSGLDVSEINKTSQMYEQLKKDLKPTNVYPLEFEKDVDSNFHMSFITACSNLRAICYGIPIADFNKTKKIAGKIIPAIATTTAVVAGLACIEFLKVVMKLDDIEKYKNSYTNLGLCFLTGSEPCPPRNMSECGGNFTIWDFIEVHGMRPDGKEMLLEDLINYLKDKKDLSDISMISCGSKMLFASFSKNSFSRLKKTLKEAYFELFQKEIQEHVDCLTFDIFGYDLEGEDIDLPMVKYYFN